MKQFAYFKLYATKIRVSTPEEREKVFGRSDHVKIYARDYKNRLEKAGFSVKVYNLTEELANLSRKSLDC